MEVVKSMTLMTHLRRVRGDTNLDLVQEGQLERVPEFPIGTMPSLIFVDSLVVVTNEGLTGDPMVIEAVSNENRVRSTNSSKRSGSKAQKNKAKKLDGECFETTNDEEER